MHPLRLVVPSLTLALAACAAAPNPAPSTSPAVYAPPSRPPVASLPAAAPASARAAEAPTPADQPPAAPASNGLVIMTVAGQPVDVSELLAQWMHQSSLEVKEQLDRLILARLVLAEASRLGLAIDPARAEKSYADAAGAIERDLAKKKPGLTLDKYVDQALGLDPKAYRERLRDDALRGLLAERVMRAFTLQSEHADLRVIVVKSEDALKEAQAALAAGESFEDVARKHSSEGSAKDGGRVPPVIRSDTVMGKLAFETPVGAVGGPKYEQGAWLLVKVVARPEPLFGDWKVIGKQVEDSLVERAIEDLELSQWQSAMLRRYDVDITPLLKLVGQPVH